MPLGGRPASPARSMPRQGRAPPSLAGAFRLACLARPELENEGRNPEMMKRSGLLSGYAAFVGKVRENGKTMPKKKELDAAVKHCIDNDILKSFFEKHGSEVKKMMLGKWNMEDALAEGREEAWEEGLEEGREEGEARALESTARKALAKGLPVEIVSEITGLDIETINSFAPV